MILVSGNVDQKQGEIKLTERQHRHVLKVLRPHLGDQLRVGQINTGIALAEVYEVSSEQVKIKLVENWTPIISAYQPRLILALPRPKSFRRMLRQAVVLGYKDIHFCHSYRVEKSYWQSPLLKTPSVQEDIVWGLEQAGDVCWPQVYFHRKFKPFFEDEAAQWAASSKVAVCAHPGAPTSALKCANDIEAIAIGPEGGWIEYELELMKRLGFQLQSFTARTLSCEAALPFITGRLSG